jgi:hypothetical protein
MQHFLVTVGEYRVPFDGSLFRQEDIDAAATGQDNAITKAMSKYIKTYDSNPVALTIVRVALGERKGRVATTRVETPTAPTKSDRAAWVNSTTTTTTTKAKKGKVVKDSQPKSPIPPTQYNTEKKESYVPDFEFYGGTGF